MSDQQTALVLWLSKVIQQPTLKIQDLKNPKIFLQLSLKLPNMPAIQFIQPNQNVPVWQTNYMNLKNIYQAIEHYHKSEVKRPLPMGLSPVNLSELSKGQDRDGMLSMLIIFFSASINSKENGKFISYITECEEKVQEQLMLLIQQKRLLQSIQSSVEEINGPQVQQIERNKIDELYFKLQSLAAQNQSLTVTLLAEADEKVKMKEQIKKLEQDNKKLKREVDQKTLYIQQKQIQQQEQQSTQKVLYDSNQQVIHMLKKQLVDQQEQHLREKKQIQDKIQVLTQQLSVARDKIAELQSDDLIGMTSNRKIHHQDCVSINEHKNITQKLQMKLKLLEQKQTQLQRQVLRSKYQYQQLTRKCKKQEKQKQNLKAECEKMSVNRSQLISQKDAQRMKLSILQAIREKLKNKLNEQQKKVQKV